MQRVSPEVSLRRATFRSEGMLNLRKMGADGDNWIPLHSNGKIMGLMLRELHPAAI